MNKLPITIYETTRRWQGTLCRALPETRFTIKTAPIEELKLSFSTSGRGLVVIELNEENQDTIFSLCAGFAATHPLCKIVICLSLEIAAQYEQEQIFGSEQEHSQRENLEQLCYEVGALAVLDSTFEVNEIVEIAMRMSRDPRYLESTENDPAAMYLKQFA